MELGPSLFRSHPKCRFLSEALLDYPLRGCSPSPLPLPSVLALSHCPPFGHCMITFGNYCYVCFLYYSPLNVSLVRAGVLPIWHVVGHQEIFDDWLRKAHWHGAEQAADRQLMLVAPPSCSVLHLFGLPLSLLVRSSLSAGSLAGCQHLPLSRTPSPAASPAFKPWSFWCPSWVFVPPVSCCRPWPADDFQALPHPWDDTGSLLLVTLRREFCFNQYLPCKGMANPTEQRGSLLVPVTASQSPPQRGWAQRPHHQEAATEWSRDGLGPGGGEECRGQSLSSLEPSLERPFVHPSPGSG